MLGKQVLVPILPVSSADQVIPLIRSIASTTFIAGIPHYQTQPETVIPWASTTAPRKLLTAPEVNTIRQICGSLEGLEKATRMRDGRWQLENCLGQEAATAVFEFWDDEWIA